MISGSADELLIQHFVGSQREGIGRFWADPATDRWWCSDEVLAIVGCSVASQELTWQGVVERIPEADRPAVAGAYRQACRRPGLFSWSHRLHTSTGSVRSVLVVGESSRETPFERPGESPVPAGLVLRGHVVDLSELRLRATQAAADEAVARCQAQLAVIEQAKGALMLAHGIDGVAAFVLLRAHSHGTNRSITTVAAEVLQQLVTGCAGDGLHAVLDRVLDRTQPRPPTRS